MTLYTEDNIRNRLKGALAEKLFHLVHEEMNCLVFHTGHEFLYPNLLKIANISKKKYHQFIKNNETEVLSKNIGIDKENINELVGKMRFGHTATGLHISHSPDFTIITKQGNIIQFEVKFRKEPKLSEDEKESFVKKYPNAYIFLVSSKMPYISICGQRSDYGQLGTSIKK